MAGARGRPALDLVDQRGRDPSGQFVEMPAAALAGDMPLTPETPPRARARGVTFKTFEGMPDG
jgi:hypothetical protein